MKLLVGLGNPGNEYEVTRHNAGFLILDLLAEEEKLAWSNDVRFGGHVAKGSIMGVSSVLLKPMTFMNRSGFSVSAIIRYLKIMPKEVIVFHDDIDLPYGKVRAREGGGHGGHNGIRSIIAETGSSDFYRIKLGVGRPEGEAANKFEAVSSWVLGRMSESDLQTLRKSMFADAKLRLKGIFEKSV